MVLRAAGDHRWSWGERDPQRVVSLALRRLVLRRRSASGRRGRGETPVF